MFFFIYIYPHNNTYNSYILKQNHYYLDSVHQNMK